MLALRAIPAIYHAFRCPCCRQEISLSVSSIPTGQQSKHTAGIEGKEDGSVFCASKDSLPFPPTRWWSPVVAGGDTRSTLSSFKAAPDPVIGVCVGWGGRNLLSLSFGSATAIHESFAFRTRKLCCFGVLLASMRPLSTEPLQIRFRAAARGNNDVSVGGGGLLLLQHCALLLLFGDYFFIFLTELWSAF